VLPQLDGRIYLGLTDEPVTDIEDVPHPPQREIDELTGYLTAALDRPVDPAHILGAFAGLRPMLSDGGNAATADLSRRHKVLHGEHGAVHVVGGKLTTYRRMAQDAVDAAIADTGLTAGPCVTERLPLVGAASTARLAGRPESALQVARYGTEAALVATLERADPTLSEPIAPEVPVTRAELLFSVRHEGALTADDLLDRRFRVGMVAADRAAAMPAALEAIAAGG
jgi:glycerol-3-phosphate dehydrogenase